MYSIGSMLLLVICVVLPLSYSLRHMGNEYNYQKIKPDQIALYFGALVVAAFGRYSYILFKLWDDSKWLGRYGIMDEANLLWVIRGKDRLIVTYRFWTAAGDEVSKETVIDADGPAPLAELKAGDVVPILFDPRSPKKRSMLWAEIERYVTVKERGSKNPASMPVA